MLTILLLWNKRRGRREEKEKEKGEERRGREGKGMKEAKFLLVNPYKSFFVKIMASNKRKATNVCPLFF